MRAFGLDISKYQAPEDLDMAHGIDFDVMLSKVDFLCVRAGYAGSATLKGHEDERVRDYMVDLLPRLRENPIPFTFYWYFRDDASISSQATVFSRIVNEFKDVITLPLVVDAEVFIKSESLSTQKLKDFDTEVTRMTGLEVDLLYARSWQLNSETVAGLEKEYKHLWIARYFRDPQSSEPWVIPPDNAMLKPRDYDTWTFWQYTDEADSKQFGVGPYGSKGIDCNVFNGTREDLFAFSSVEEEVPDPEPEEELLIVENGAMWTTAVTAHEGDFASQLLLLTNVPPAGEEGVFSPKTVALSFEQGLVDKLSLFYVINGVAFPLYTNLGGKYRSHLHVALPDIKMQDGDFFMVEADILEEGVYPFFRIAVTWQEG